MLLKKIQNGLVVSAIEIESYDFNKDFKRVQVVSLNSGTIVLFEQKALHDKGASLEIYTNSGEKLFEL